MDRINLIQTFIETFGKERIQYILGDREFIGKIWVEWLEQESIPYDLRVTENGQYITNSNGEMVKAQDLFKDLKPGEYRTLGKRDICKTNPYKGHVSGFKTARGDIVVLIHSESIVEPWEIYRVRWEIEVLFKALKTGGFNLEDTHIMDFDRFDTLLAVLAIPCCLAYRVGEFVTEVEPPKIKNNGYKPHSFIRYGIDCLREIVRKTIYSTGLLVQEVINRIQENILNQYRGVSKIVM